MLLRAPREWLFLSDTPFRDIYEIVDFKLPHAKVDWTAAELKKRTLTNLYNSRPGWLAIAHQNLDKAVLAAYGWPMDISEQDSLSHLLKLNHERGTSANGAA